MPFTFSNSSIADRIYPVKRRDKIFFRTNNRLFGDSFLFQKWRGLFDDFRIMNWGDLVYLLPELNNLKVKFKSV